MAGGSSGRWPRRSTGEMTVGAEWGVIETELEDVFDLVEDLLEEEEKVGHARLGGRGADLELAKVLGQAAGQFFCLYKAF